MVTQLNAHPIPSSPTQQERLESLQTFKEAMAYLRVSRSTLYRLMWSGQLVGHKVGNTWRFLPSDLKKCVIPKGSQGQGGEGW